MSLELSDAAVIVSLREGVLVAEACSADVAEDARTEAIARCEFLCMRFVHDMNTALRAADDIDGTTLVDAPSARAMREWAEGQLDDSMGECRELREHDDGGDGDGGSLVLA